MPTMHRQMESLVKAVELMREGQEDNADSDDNDLSLDMTGGTSNIPMVD